MDTTSALRNLRTTAVENGFEDVNNRDDEDLIVTALNYLSQNLEDVFEQTDETLEDFLSKFGIETEEIDQEYDLPTHYLDENDNWHDENED